MKKRQEGSVLLFAIGVISLLGLLGGSMASLQNTSITSIANSNDALQAQYLSESGIRYSQNKFLFADDRDLAMGEINGTGTFQVSDRGSFTLSILKDGLSYQVISTGISNGIEKQISYRYSEAPGIHNVYGYGGSSGLADVEGLDDILKGTVDFLRCLFNPNGENCEAIKDCARTFLVTGECSSVYISEGAIANTDLVSGLGQVIHVVENALARRIYSGGQVQVGINATVTESIVSKKKVSLLGNSIVGDPTLKNGEIHTEGGANIGGVVYGNIHSKGDVLLDVTPIASFNIPTVEGSIYTDGNLTLKEIRSGQGAVVNGDVVVTEDLHLDRGAVINGDVFVQGKITGEGTINGKIYHVGTLDSRIKTGVSGSAVQVSSIKTQDGYVEPSPIPYQQMGEPTIATITPGTGNVSSSQTDPPSAGEYHQFQIKNNETLVLQPGSYHLSTFDISENATIQLDLTTASDINLFVENGMTVGDNFNIEVRVMTDSGEQIISTATSDPDEIKILEQYAPHFYLETHGDWRLSDRGNWLGTVFSTQNLTVDSSDSAGNLIGSFYSNERLKINSEKNMSRVSSNYVKNNWM